MSVVLGLQEVADSLGVGLHDVVSRMHREGLILVLPDEVDSACCVVSGFESHCADCGCGFVLIHPDVVMIDGLLK